MHKSGLKHFVEKYPFTTGVIRKASIDLTSDFIDRKITIAGWQTILASNNFAVCSHLTYKIHSQNNAAIPLLPFCSIEDKWIREIYLTNDLAQPGVSVDFIIVHPPTKLNYTGIYSQTIDTGGSITEILNNILAKNTEIDAVLDNLLTKVPIGSDFVKTLEVYSASNVLTIPNNKRARLIGAFATYDAGLAGVDKLSLIIDINNGANFLFESVSPDTAVTGVHVASWCPGSGSPSVFNNLKIVLPCLNEWIKPLDAGSGIRFSIDPAGPAGANFLFVYEVES